jgi:hypothetical protein
MLLKSKSSDGLIEIAELEELINPAKDRVTGQAQSGEEEQEPESFKKEDLVFPSGEKLPLCWLDSNYKLKN